MSDTTAQAFREAADDGMLKRHIRDLLLAAAEQREQLEALLQLNEADNRTQAAYHEQIATLTAERDEARTLVQTLGDQAERFRRERDDPRAKD